MKDKLFESLKKFSESQLAEVIYLYGVPLEYFSGQNSRIEKVIELIHYVRQEENGEIKLQKIIKGIESQHQVSSYSFHYFLSEIEEKLPLYKARNINSVFPETGDKSEKIKGSQFQFEETTFLRDFVGREKEIINIFSRLLKGESTMIIGQPKSGKTILLNKIVYEIEQNKKFENFIIVPVYEIDFKLRPLEFWDEVILLLNKKLYSTPPLKKLENNSLFELKEKFKELYKQGMSCLLVIDDIDEVFFHKYLFCQEFLGVLRSLSQDVEGFSLLCSSRLFLEDINNKTQEIWRFGSDCFSYIQPIHLKLIDSKLLLSIFPKNEQDFSQQHINIIKRVAGRNPFLIKALISENKRELNKGELRSFYNTAHELFTEIWIYLDNNCKIALLTIYMIEEYGHYLINHSELTSDLHDNRKVINKLLSVGLIDYFDETDRKKYPAIKDSHDNDRELGLSSDVLSWWLGDIFIYLYAESIFFECHTDKNEIIQEHIKSSLRFSSLASFLRHAESTRIINFSI